MNEYYENNPFSNLKSLFNSFILNNRTSRLFNENYRISRINTDSNFYEFLIEELNFEENSITKLGIIYKPISNKSKEIALYKKTQTGEPIFFINNKKNYIQLLRKDKYSYKELLILISKNLIYIPESKFYSLNLKNLEFNIEYNTYSAKYNKAIPIQRLIDDSSNRYYLNKKVWNVTATIPKNLEQVYNGLYRELFKISKKYLPKYKKYYSYILCRDKNHNAEIYLISQSLTIGQIKNYIDKKIYIESNLNKLLKDLNSLDPVNFLSIIKFNVALI